MTEINEIKRDNMLLDFIHRHFPHIPIGDDTAWRRLLQFAKEVYSAGAAAEREECAKVCDEEAEQFKKFSEKYDCQGDAAYFNRQVGAEDCAEAIRALGDDDD